jgi:hypothetical protein
MNDRTESSAAAAPPPIDGRTSFVAALHWGLQAAAGRGARRLLCTSTDFDAWPLDDPAWLQALQPWLRLPQRRLVMLAVHYDALPRQHPRFTRWRRDWAHAIDTLAVPDEAAPRLPTLLLDDGPVLVQLTDPVRWRGRAALDAPGAQAWRHEIEALAQQSVPAFAVTSLGL